MFFVDPPADFSPQFTTVAVAVEYSDQLLVIQRALGIYAGYWGLPAGKQQGNETLIETAVRELQEETGIALNPAELSLILSRATRYQEADFWFHMFRAKLEQPPLVQPNMREIAEHRWLTPKQALKLRFLPDFDHQLRALNPRSN